MLKIDLEKGGYQRQFHSHIKLNEKDHQSHRHQSHNLSQELRKKLRIVPKNYRHFSSIEKVFLIKVTNRDIFLIYFQHKVSVIL